MPLEIPIQYNGISGPKLLQAHIVTGYAINNIMCTGLPEASGIDPKATAARKIALRESILIENHSPVARYKYHPYSKTANNAMHD